MSLPIPRACLMGHPVAHSRSPMIHGYWLKTLGIAGAYTLEDVRPERFEGFFRTLRDHGYVGGNITVPHKEAAFRLVDRREPAAEAVGAVNTVWYEGDSLVGGNTDTHGFIDDLDARIPGWNVPRCRALVVGAGGGARSVVYTLAQRGVHVTIMNRTASRAEALARQFGPLVDVQPLDDVARMMRDADLMVNCTSAGMAGKPDLGLDLAPLKPSAVVVDLVYVPLETKLLRDARLRGHPTVDGLGMLLRQAGYGFQHWFGGEPQVTQELRAIVEADILAKSPAPR